MIAALFVALLGLAAGSIFLTLALVRHWQRLYPPVGHRVDVGEGRLHVVETPPAAGQVRGAVLLVHGASGNFADPHEALAERLAELGFRVFSVDRPGHGYSDRIAGRAATSPRRQAGFIREALARLGVGEAIVVVHSLAGALGLAMALDSPAFTRGLVLLAPVSHPWPGGVSWYYTVAATPVLGALFRWLVAPLAGLALMRDGLVEVFRPNPVPPDYARRTRLPLVFRPSQFLANAQDFVDLRAATVALSPRYGEVRAPTAILMGEEDTLVSANLHARALGRTIPGAELHMLEGVGHSPHFSAPEAVIAAIIEVDNRAAASERIAPAMQAN